MLIEKIVFVVLALYLLIMMFFKLIKNIDKIYISVLIVQLIGLILGLIEIIFMFDFNIIVKIIMYLMSVIIPIAILLMEKKGKALWLALIDKYPENYLAHRKLAEIYEKEGGMRKAIDEYVKSVDINKKDYDSYYRISFLLNELGSKEDAKVMLNNLLSKKPDYTDATILLRRYIVLRGNV